MKGTHRREQRPSSAHRRRQHRQRRRPVGGWLVVALGISLTLTTLVAATVFARGSAEQADSQTTSVSTSLDAGPVAVPGSTQTGLDAAGEVPAADPAARRVTASVSSKSRARSAGLAVPEHGSGSFDVATGSSPTVGSGTLTTYEVELERDLGIPTGPVVRKVDAVLADPRGWTAQGDHSLARIENAADIRILLATPETTDELCAPLNTGGRLSCRNGNLVVLNAWRWMNGATGYRGDLVDYRAYLINHEVGHALGNAHASCPGPGEPAPVMMQQTKGLDSCVANPWPWP